MFDDQSIYDTAYDWTDGAEDLPWHRERLPPLLHAFLGRETEPLSILDLGSGAGTIAVALAERGHEVVGVDFVEAAVEMSRARADERGVDVDFVHADVLAWEAPTSFDLVVDVGCLHGFSPANVDRYVERLPVLLADDGDYFLSHFLKRHFLDWRPVGPTRRRIEEIVELMPDGFEMETYAHERIYPALLAGPTARFGHFWFSRAAPQ